MQRASRAGLGQPRSRRQIETGSPLSWWYFLSAPAPVPSSASFLERERVRRGRIGSVILLGMLVGIVLLAVNVALLRAILPSVLLVAGCCLVAIPLNRAGYVRATGVLLIVAIDGGLVWALLSAPGGLDPLYLPAFYLLVTSDLIVAALLPVGFVFPLAAAHAIFIIADVKLQPHTMMWDQMITSTGILYSSVIGPMALEIVVSILAYLWVTSAVSALRRADRAEEIVALERRELEQRRQVAMGIQQILDTHLRFANGDLNARAPSAQDNVLWQVSVALNNLLARYQRMIQEGSASNAIAEEVRQMRGALRAWQDGQPQPWPRPNGSALDPLIADLQHLFSYLPTDAASGSPQHDLPTLRGRIPSQAAPAPFRQQPSGWPSQASQASQASQPGAWPDLWPGQAQQPNPSGAPEPWLWRPERE